MICPRADVVGSLLRPPALLSAQKGLAAGALTPAQFKRVEDRAVDQAVEDRDHLIRRIREASRYVSLDRLGISPQCGFASSILGNRLSAEDQARKLRLVAETAEAVWGGAAPTLR